MMRGEVAIAGRAGRERLWDLAERVYPADLVIPTEDDARRIKNERRLASLGIARQKTTAMPIEPVDVGDAGEPAVVEGTKGEWRVDPAALGVDFEGRTALLSPFDRLVYDRRRAQELFEFEYTLEMYKPAAKRRWGYYALPVLHDDRLVGKVDATADRKASVLRVHAIHEDVTFTRAIARAVRPSWTTWPRGSGWVRSSRPRTDPGRQSRLQATSCRLLGIGKPAVAVRSRLAGQERGIRDIPISRVLLDARAVALRCLVGGEAERVGLSVVGARSNRDHEARTASRSDDDVLRVGWAVHEIPRAELSFPALDDQEGFARDDQECLLIGLPVIHRHRLTRHEHERVDAELVGLATPAFEIVADDADCSAAVGVTPFGVAHVEDVPSPARRGDPVLGLLQFRLGNHEPRSLP